MTAGKSKTAELLITGPGGDRKVALPDEGAIIGRAKACDVVLDDAEVSRRHARLHKDPFGRWIVKDLGSRNGTWIGGEAVTRRAISHGDCVAIFPFTLRLSEPLAERIARDESVRTTSTLALGSAKEELVQSHAEAEETLSGNRLSELNRIIDRLVAIRNSSELYGEACRCLATTPETSALVLRLAHEAAAAKEPEILGCRFAPSAAGDLSGQPDSFRLSQRVVEAVRSSRLAVMASNVHLSNDQMDLTVMDSSRPRAVYCAPITAAEAWTDALYLEMPAARAATETLDFLRAVARQVGFAGKSILLAEQTAKRALLDHQLKTAREIQMNLIPRSLDLAPQVDVALSYEPALWVGGDFCDVWALPDGRIAFAVGDVSGKGLPAALVMADCRATLRTALNFCRDVDKAVSHVSRHLDESTPGHVFVTMFLGLLDPATGRLEYVNAGHVLPLLAGPGKGVSALGEPKCCPLGILETRFTRDEVLLEPGTALVAVTDGVTEAVSPDGQAFGWQRLLGLLERNLSACGSDLVGAILNEVSAFRGDLPQHDDVTVLALRNRGSG